MSANGVKKFVAAIDLVYPAPQYDGDKTRQAAWLGLLTQTIGLKSDEVLAEAAAIIMRTYDGRFFPTPKHCLAACEEAAAAIERRRTPLLEHKAPEMRYEAKVALARDLMQHPIGKQAIKDGWGQVMFNFCMKNQRAPSGSEIDACKREAREFNSVYEGLLREQGTLASSLARYAESIVQKARDHMQGKAA